MKKPVQRENEECHSPSRTTSNMHSPLKKATNKPYGTRIEIIPGKLKFDKISVTHVAHVVVNTTLPTAIEHWILSIL